MPVNYTISTDQTLVEVSATGLVTRQDMDALRARLLSDPRIRYGMQLILETSKVDSRLTFADLQEIAGRLSGIYERGIRRVAVLTDSRYAYSLARTFAIFAANEPVRMMPFRARESAVEWLKTGIAPREDDAADIEPQSVFDRDDSLVDAPHPRRRTPWAAMRSITKKI